MNVRGRHTTVRAHQRSRTDRMDMTLGPFRFEVVEPFRQWRLTPRPRPRGTARDRLDITWLDTKRPVFRQLGAGIIVGGRAMSPVAGYDGFGRQEGWVEVDGERFDLAPTTHLGTRDHHWGTRDGVGGPGRYMGMQHPHSGEWVEFEDFGIWGDHVLYNLGDARKRSGTLAKRVHRMRFEPETTPAAQRRGRPRLRRRRRSRRCPSSGSATRSPSSAVACTAARTAARPTATSGTAWPSPRATRSSSTARPST